MMGSQPFRLQAGKSYWSELGVRVGPMMECGPDLFVPESLEGSWRADGLPRGEISRIYGPLTEEIFEPATQEARS